MLGYIRKRLIKSTLTKEDFERTYALLDVPALGSTSKIDVHAPMPSDGDSVESLAGGEPDCGALCKRICCQEYEPGVGMYLLPGEEAMFTGKEPWLKWSYKSARHHDFPDSWKGLVPFAMCQGTCPREKRPVQCRTFPLMPYLDEEGNLSMRLDRLTGSLVCPLVRYPEHHPLSSELQERALKAWTILIKDPLIRDDVEEQSRKLDEDEKSPWRGLI